MAVVSCDCGFRGKEPELVDGKCPRCGKAVKEEGKPVSRSRRKSEDSEG